MLINKYGITKSRLRIAINRFLTKCENIGEVVEASLLTRELSSAFDFIATSNPNDFGETNIRLHHKYKTDSAGTLYFYWAYIPSKMKSILVIEDWDWQVDPYVFSRLYPLLLQTKPIYSIVGNGGCGTSIVKAPNGWMNFITSDNKLLSKQWF